MGWNLIWEAVKFIFHALPGEVNFPLLEQIAWQVYQGGWSKKAFLSSALAEQAKLFPDARTRSLIVLVLEGLLSLE
jgi:hypothetical protein